MTRTGRIGGSFLNRWAALGLLSALILTGPLASAHEATAEPVPRAAAPAPTVALGATGHAPTPTAAPVTLGAAASATGSATASAPTNSAGPAPYSEPFYAGGTYEAGVPSPADYMGRPIGERPARYEELVGYMRKLSEASPRVEMASYGQTHEGRKLYYIVVSSRENMDRLQEIKAAIGRLSDPRATDDREADHIIRDNPAVAWMAYSIHGDELSSTDAAMRLAYQLAAGTDSLTTYLRRHLVIVIDPLQNPDGRERFLGMMQQVAGAIPSWDVQSLQHTGYWPTGRGNHYLFDLNRDWFIQVHPETRGKVKAIVDWNPQLMVDSHEMGALDTYLFSPPRDPFNPNVTERMRKWWKRFADDQAHAFDRHGWSYYTEEWNEEWFPGYGSSWPLYTGAMGILYEEAGVDGSLIKRRDGTYLTYRESVHHHFVSSLANLQTAAANKNELMRDFYREKKRSLRGGRSSGENAFVLIPGRNPERAEALANSLVRQGIEVRVARDEISSRGLRDYWDESPRSKRLPAGAYVVPLDQPMGLLAETLLEFDPRMTDGSLSKERYELEKKGKSRIYDVTAWSLPIMMGIETYSSKSRIKGDLERAEMARVKPGVLRNDGASYGFLIDGGSDRSLVAAVALMDAGYKVRHTSRPFTVEGRRFSRGTLLMRARENAEGLSAALAKVCRATGVDAYGVESAMTSEGPDLGGGRFRLLEAPRVCLLGGSPVSPTSYGALWFMLDHALGVRSSRVDIGRLTRTNLDKYNVIIMPNAWGGAYKEGLGKAGVRKLRRWVEEGGTLIAMSAAATALADTSVGMSKVRLRRQVLGKLAAYDAALANEPSGPPPIDSLAVWEWTPPEEKGPAKERGKPPAATAKKGAKGSIAKLKTEDERLRLFRPRGALLRVDLDREHWLAGGAEDRVPALTMSSFALMSKRPVETVGRFAEASDLRISGLLWPEARARWAKTAYVTREALGKGQIVLFLDEPYFRAQTLGTGRLIMNAVVLGPGLGTKRPQPW